MTEEDAPFYCKIKRMCPLHPTIHELANCPDNFCIECLKYFDRNEVIYIIEKFDIKLGDIDEH